MRGGVVSGSGGGRGGVAHVEIGRRGRRRGGGRIGWSGRPEKADLGGEVVPPWNVGSSSGEARSIIGFVDPFLPDA